MTNFRGRNGRNTARSQLATRASGTVEHLPSPSHPGFGRISYEYRYRLYYIPAKRNAAGENWVKLWLNRNREFGRIPGFRPVFAAVWGVKRWEKRHVVGNRTTVRKVTTTIGTTFGKERNSLRLGAFERVKQSFQGYRTAAGGRAVPCRAIRREGVETERRIAGIWRPWAGLNYAKTFCSRFHRSHSRCKAPHSRSLAFDSSK